MHTAEDIKAIRKVCESKQKHAFEYVSQSIAPSIYGHQHIKMALLALLIGGEAKHLPGGARIRGCVTDCAHVLCCLGGRGGGLVYISLLSELLPSLALLVSYTSMCL